MSDEATHRSMPRSVLVASDQLYKQISTDPNSVALLQDTEALIVPFSTSIVAQEQLATKVRNLLRDSQQLKSGALLVRNPYENAAYEYAESAIETFALAKYHALANVARILGAKEVQFKEAKGEKSQSRRAGGLKAFLPGGGGELDFVNVVTDNLTNRLEGNMTFPGGTPAPTDAITYLTKKNLARDQQLQALVDMRTGDNPITTYKMTLNGTHEADSNVDAALKIANAGPVKAANIGATFSAQANSIKSIDITTIITF